MKKLLVAIASYGNKNDKYLERVLSEYRKMPYDTDIVVLSNIHKDLGSDIEVIVGLPTKDPWSLPFGHRRLFAERLHSYDLFLYSEDDMLISHKNIEAFLTVSGVLQPNEVLGFFQWEQYPDGRKFFPAVHGHFHWIPRSVRTVGEYKFAQFSNEHSACYLLTREQLQKAIESGGFLVRPHEHKHDLLVTAGTDPYTQCGFKKVLCISHFDDFLIAHLPNRYIGTSLGQDAPDFYKQITRLLVDEDNGVLQKALVEAETRVFHCLWSKDYYEPIRQDLLAHLPDDIQCVLSIGCGWGATEAALVERGCRVVGIPIDQVIGTCAASRGVEIISSDLEEAKVALANRKFDAVLIFGVLHLFPDPGEAIRLASSVLSDTGVLVASIPNLRRVPFLWRRLRRLTRYAGISEYHASGVHLIGRRKAKKMFSEAGLFVRNILDIIPPNWRHLVEKTRGLAAPLFSLEYVVIAQQLEKTQRATLAKEPAGEVAIR